MNRRSFIARTLAALSAVAAWPRSLFATKPLDMTVTAAPKLLLRVYDFHGATLATATVTLQPASCGAVPFRAAGTITQTGEASHAKLINNGWMIATFPITGNPGDGLSFESRHFQRGMVIDVVGTLSDPWGVMKL